MMKPVFTGHVHTLLLKGRIRNMDRGDPPMTDSPLVSKGGKGFCKYDTIHFPGRGGMSLPPIGYPVRDIEYYWKGEIVAFIEMPKAHKIDLRHELTLRGHTGFLAFTIG